MYRVRFLKVKHLSKSIIEELKPDGRKLIMTFPHLETLTYWPGPHVAAIITDLEEMACARAKTGYRCLNLFKMPQ
jgi:hypothetical protein